MTTQEKIDAVRQKCIEANPEKKCKACRGRGFFQRSGNRCKVCRKLRLADVLLAFPLYSAFVLISGDELVIRTSNGKEVFIWNLRKDSLDEQSSETIDFLLSLLLPPSSDDL